MNQHVLVFKTSNKYRMVIGSNGGQSYEYITQDRNTTLTFMTDMCNIISVPVIVLLTLLFHFSQQCKSPLTSLPSV
jgi:hypothetical protein